MDGCGNILLMLLALLVLMPGLCFVANGLASLPGIFAGDFGRIFTLITSLLLGGVFVLSGIALFSRMGKSGGDGDE